VDAAASCALRGALKGAPAFEGPGIRVTFRENLRAVRGKLRTGDRARRTTHGLEVHAATFMRKRRMVLDRALLRKPDELRRILIHELFHFAWARLGNARRAGYEAVVRREMEERARGELGWSAEMRKRRLPAREGRCWREYVCESFCDTGAWLYAGVKRHDEYTLAARFRKRRVAWFAQAFGGGAVRI